MVLSPLWLLLCAVIHQLSPHSLQDKCSSDFTTPIESLIGYFTSYFLICTFTVLYKHLKSREAACVQQCLCPLTSAFNFGSYLAQACILAYRINIHQGLTFSACKTYPVLWTNLTATPTGPPCTVWTAKCLNRAYIKDHTTIFKIPETSNRIKYNNLCL